MKTVKFSLMMAAIILGAFAPIGYSEEAMGTVAETPSDNSSETGITGSSQPKPFTQEAWAHPPQVKITQWGEELRLEVELSELMEKEQMLDIDSVGLHTEQGDLLGFKTFDPQDDQKRTEFMIDPKALKLEKVKIVVHGVRLNEWSTITPLKVTEEAAPETAIEPVPAPVETATIPTESKEVKKKDKKKS